MVCRSSLDITFLRPWPRIPTIEAANTDASTESPMVSSEIRANGASAPHVARCFKTEAMSAGLLMSGGVCLREREREREREIVQHADIVCISTKRRRFKEKREMPLRGSLCFNETLLGGADWPPRQHALT